MAAPSEFSEIREAQDEATHQLIFLSGRKGLRMSQKGCT